MSALPEDLDRLEADAHVAAATESVASVLAVVSAFFTSLHGEATGGEKLAHDKKNAVRAVSALLPAFSASESDLTGDCRACPICRGLAALRAFSPEFVDSLGDMVDNVLSALTHEFSSSRPDAESD